MNRLHSSLSGPFQVLMYMSLRRSHSISMVDTLYCSVKLGKNWEDRTTYIKVFLPTASVS